MGTPENNEFVQAYRNYTRALEAEEAEHGPIKWGIPYELTVKNVRGLMEAQRLISSDPENDRFTIKTSRGREATPLRLDATDAEIQEALNSLY